MDPEKLPYQAFYPVAKNGPADLSANRDAKSAGAACFFQRKNDEMRGVTLFSPFADAEVFPTAPQAKGRGKMLRSAQTEPLLFAWNGRREGFPPPGPASLDNDAPIFALHALAETMGPFPADFTGLVRSFHLLVTPVYDTYLNRFLSKAYFKPHFALGVKVESPDQFFISFRRPSRNLKISCKHPSALLG
jgi:hypothetical protein